MSALRATFVILTLGAGAFAAAAEPGPGGARIDRDAAAIGPAAEAHARQHASPPYDGRYTFVRLRFGEGDGGLSRGGFGRRGGREPVWSHDYPRAENHFLRILDELTKVGPDRDATAILATDDPELFRHPVAYIVEVGYWRPNEAEVEGLRSWLLKGGFLIVDDFRGPDLYNFQAQLQRVLPGARLVRLEADQPIFDSFFRIADPYTLAPPTYAQYKPVYLGVFEDNDPDGRLMLIANYNNDIAEYWEFSDFGYYPIDLSNEAYKFGVNYVIYGMTH